MNFIYKLERKLGKYAIPNLMMYVIGAYVIGLVLYYFAPGMLNYLTLEPYYVFKGQIWRLISWIFVPSSVGILTIIMLIFYYQIGTHLEYYWGTFRFNLYMWGGLLFTDIAALLLYGIIYAVLGQPMLLSGLFSTSYINLSLFLAFAACFPEMEVRLYFLIPIKMKWLAIVYILITLYEIFSNGLSFNTIIVGTAIGASLLNFIIFYFSTKNMKRFAPNEIHRRKKFKRQVQQSTKSTKHKCAICGRTEKDDPNLQFRYCSKCDGNYEYCQEHLFTHQHIKHN